MQLKNLSKQELISKLESLVRSERKVTAEILDHIKEFDRRRLYIELGHTSLFAYLTKGLGYTPASAQRRIEAARLMRSVPEISQDVASGALNLSQVALVAQGIREKSAEAVGRNARESVSAQQTALELFAEIKNLDMAATQVTVARKLDLQIKSHEKKRFQQDQSLRLEISVSPEQQQLFAKAKELLSHVKHNPNWIELFVLLARDSIKMRDPLAKKSRVPEPKSCRTGATEAVAPQRQERLPIPSAVKRIVLQRDRCCQWRDLKSGVQCSSRYQLQFDHIDPVREGGGNSPENLQLLCSVHNRQKYRQERRQGP